MPSAGKRPDPYKNFNFVVQIDGIDQAAFSEVSGLQAETEVIEYREGSDPLASSRKLPGVIKYGNVTLKRGVTQSRDLWDWWRTVATGAVERRNVAIVLLDDARQPVKRWLLRGAFPAKYQAPDLNAKGNDVAIETLELAHEGLELD
ncbi:MAG TPA: phage tail protein [Gaiellaceae bacterium]|nr:phage tail protein [Gaiellaceae bacterium]